MALEPGTRLGRYEIVVLRGKGGMGEVYRGRDTLLDRDVAIKVLPPELSANTAFRRRFDLEARAISRLQHPNVCTLYDVGSEASIQYLVMEYLEGMTLAERLRGGPLPIDEVLRIGREVAGAVDAAHERGIVHRDLKPGNVVLGAEGAKVLDFGLAREIELDSGRDVPETQVATRVAPLTERGTIAGTVPYMPPEQLQGKKTDARSDIWAMGCLLYEMATGERPFVGESQADLIVSIMGPPPPLLTRRRSDAPARLASLVARCLEKAPARRWPTARAVVMEIDALRAPPRASVENPSSEQTIAILPLVNRSADPENEYLCDAVSEELISGLSNVEGLKVASLLSSFAFKNQNIDVGLMGERLKVDHILNGSVQKAGNRVRINVLLSLVADGSSLWSHRYDRELDDIFELQEDVARQVIDALKIELGADRSRPLLDLGTQNGQAYESFLVGLHEARRGTRERLEKAVAHLRRAAELDPKFARVYWWLYFCYWRLIGVGLPREEMEPKAEEALDKAREAGFVPPVPWIKARRDLFPDTRPGQRYLAAEACEKLRRPDPEWRGFEYIQMGECLTAAGLHHGACDYYEHYLDRARHDLSATWIEQRYGSLLAQIGRFDKAIDRWTEFIAANPDDPTGYGYRSLLYHRIGQHEKAVRDSAKVGKSSFDTFIGLYWRGELEAARRFYEDPEFNKKEPLYKYWVCFLLGELDEGMDHLEEDVRRGAHPAVFRSNIGEVVPQSVLREVEAHPRYKAVLKQFGIDDAWRDELLAMANDLTGVTGIHVQLDDAY